MTMSFFKFMKFAPHSRLSLFMLLKHKSIFFARKSVLNDPTDCSPFIYTDIDGNDIKKEILGIDGELSSEAGFIEYTGWISRRIRELIEMENLSNDAEVKNRRRRSVYLNGETYDEYNEELGKKFLKYYFQQSIDDAKIFSMSTVLEEPRMWAHYAEGHSGFCIELSGLDSTPPGIYLEKVDYTSRRPRISISDLKAFPNTTSTERLNDIMSRLYLQKSIGWEYEKEYRLVVAKRDFKKIKPVFRLPEGDYIEFSKIRVERIVFGMNTSQKERKMVEDILQDLLPQNKRPNLQQIRQIEDGYQIKADSILDDDILS